MSMMFRTIAATTKTAAQAHAIAGVLVLAIVIYTGYVIPVKYMVVWFSWIRFINPIFYAFEALLVNELHGQDFDCSRIVPAYPGVGPENFICGTPGAVQGEAFVNGDRYLQSAYEYTFGHMWRNLGFGVMFTRTLSRSLKVRRNKLTGNSRVFRHISCCHGAQLQLHLRRRIPRLPSWPRTKEAPRR